MAKRGRPPNDDVKDDVRASIAKLMVDSQPLPKIDDKVKATGEELRKRGWFKYSPRTIYALLKRFKSNTEK
jgi:hypothetical protein